MGCGEPAPAPCISGLARLLLKEDATNAVDAYLDALCESELKAASVTALAIYYPVDDPRARELLWRTYAVVPRLRNLVDLRLHMPFKDRDAVRGLYSVMCSPTIRLRTLVMPHTVVSRPELALLRTQPALELCLVRYRTSFDALNEPGVLPVACSVVAYEGQSLHGEGNKLTVDRLTVETVDRLWRVLEEGDSEYPWETVPIPSPPGVREHPDEDEGLHNVNGSSDEGSDIQEDNCDDSDDSDRRTARTVREIQLVSGGVPCHPACSHRRPMRHRPREWTPSATGYRSKLLAGRMRHPNRLDVDTVELLLDEVPHAVVMRQVPELCPDAHTINLAF